MKKTLLIFLIFAGSCYSQSKYEVGLSVGYHAKIDGIYTYTNDIYVTTPYTKTKDGFVYSGKETNFYLNVNVFREFSKSIYAGIQGQLNISKGFVNYSPMLAGKYYFSNEKIKPYARAGFGLNIMNYGKTSADEIGYIWEIAGGTNIQLSSNVNLDIGLSYNQMKNTVGSQLNVTQSISNYNVYGGIAYGF